MLYHGWGEGNDDMARVVALWLGTAAPVAAQDAEAWRGFFAAGQEGLGTEGSSAYAEQMALAAENLPAGHLN